MPILYAHPAATATRTATPVGSGRGSVSPTATATPTHTPTPTPTPTPTLRHRLHPDTTNGRSGGWRKARQIPEGARALTADHDHSLTPNPLLVTLNMTPILT